MSEEKKGSGLFEFRPWSATFRGDPVTAEVRPLKTKEMAIVLPFVIGLEGFKESAEVIDLGEGKQKIKIKDPKMIQSLFEVQGKAADIFPSAVRNLTGIPDPWETICEQMYYMGFVVDLLLHLITITQVPEDALKNSEGPSSEVK